LTRGTGSFLVQILIHHWTFNRLERNRKLAGEITAIVDWEECLSTIAPEWELSIALHDLSIDEKHAFIDGYGLSGPQIMEMVALIKAFNIVNYSGAIKSAVADQDEKMLSQFKLRLNGCLDLYSLTK